jgi:two-component system sensor histidine kinase BarA
MVEATWETLPVIDHHLRLQLVGQQADLADELLAMLKKNLTADIATISHLAATIQYVTLSQQIHRLHGAVAYCGTPRLKAILAHIEAELNKNHTQTLDHLIQQLSMESEKLLNAR